jgi:hypothetical protein
MRGASVTQQVKILFTDDPAIKHPDSTRLTMFTSSAYSPLDTRLLHVDGSVTNAVLAVASVEASALAFACLASFTTLL